MTRTRFALLPLVLFTAYRAPLYAQAPPPDAFTILERQPDGPRITPYLTYQIDMAWKQEDARRARFAAIRTEADLLRVQGELRTKLLNALGGLPTEKTPLNPQTTGRIQMEGYHVEKLVFESVPGIYVTALVYVPDNAPGKRPAVLVPCGHSSNGKAYYQALCQRLVSRGYLVICWDPIGEGERSQFWDASAGKSRYNLICGEHAILGNLAYLAGTNLARWEVWDGIRALDYLLTRPDVDSARISITGTSGGGFQAALLGALDTRIKTIVPSCYITALRMRVANRIFEDPDSDPEQDPYGMLSAGIDHAGLLLLMYPRPVFIAAAVLDFFPIDGARQAYREIDALYRRLGHADRIGMTEGYHKHNYSVENQVAAITFLDRFNDLAAHAALPVTKDLDDAAVQVTKTGQVLMDHPQARNVTDEIRDYAKTHRPAQAPTLRAAYFGAGYPAIREWVVAPFKGTSAAPNRILWEAAGTSSADGITIDKYLLHHSGGLLMPLLHVHGARPGGPKTLIWFSDRGKAGADDWPAMKAFVADGYDVVSFDARGLGETRMPYTAISIDDPSLAQKDFDHAYVSPLSSVLADYVYNSLLTGRPYMLQLIEDVEIASRFSRERLGATEVSITASGDAFTLAHDAAGVLPGLRLVAGEGAHPIAWSEIVEKKQEIWPVAYVYPGGAFIR